MTARGRVLLSLLRGAAVLGVSSTGLPRAASAGAAPFVGATRGPFLYVN